MFHFKTIVLTALVLSLATLSPALAAQLAIPGTGDGVAVLTALGDAFNGKTGVTIRVPDSIGSGGGVKVAGAGKAELARVARPVKEKEKHFGLSYKAIFNVPTVFFVHDSVSVNNLTSQQVLDIYSGKLVDWSAAGGNKGAIHVVRREDKDSSYGNLKKTFPGFKELAITEKATTAFKTPHMVNTILNEELTIGFGPLDVALANGLKVLSIDGINPTEKGYPFYGTIGLVYKPENLSDTAKTFLDYITTAEAQEVIASKGGASL